MRFLLKLLEDERWIAKLSSTKDTVMEIMKEVIDASLFINDFVNKGRFSTSFLLRISQLLTFPNSQNNSVRPRLTQSSTNTSNVLKSSAKTSKQL